MQKNNVGDPLTKGVVAPKDTTSHSRSTPDRIIKLALQKGSSYIILSVMCDVTV